MLDFLHWLPVRQRIPCRVVFLVWRCQLGLAPAYLIDLCRPVSGARGRRFLRSAERGFWWSRLPVQRLCRTAHFVWRALGFGMISIRRLFPWLCTDTILGHLKTRLFVRTVFGSASE